MKRFDYLCILYSIALLAFGFDDNTPSENPRRVEAQKEVRTNAQSIAHNDVLFNKQMTNVKTADKSTRVLRIINLKK
jgi:hypothetical protein